MMLSFFSCDDVAYVIYKTADCIGSASEYRCDAYDNALENVMSNTTSCEETIFCVPVVRILGNLFDVV